MFINLSNHPSDAWELCQKEAASVYGEIVNYPFPSIDPTESEEEVIKKAVSIAEKIIGLHPDAVMCQGEYALTYAIVSRLKEAGILTLCACSERKIEEITDADGRMTKESIFSFVQFRAYR